MYVLIFISETVNKFVKMEVHEEKKQYECWFCNEEFQDFSSLQKHILDYKCFPNNFLMPNPTNMGLASPKISQPSPKQKFASTKIHDWKEQFQCSKCFSSFSTNSNLNQHIASVHEGKKKSFNCEKCKESFRRKTQFETHVAIFHEGKKPFACSICEDRFDFKTLLNNHEMKIHGKKGRFPCKLCEETFSTKGERKKHQLWVHEEPSKYIF